MAEAIQVTRYRSFDGSEFATLAEAEAHEDANFEQILTSLTLADVRGAIARDPALLTVADALEKAGTLIAKARRDSGELRRRPREKPASERQEPAQGQTEQGNDAGTAAAA